MTENSDRSTDHPLAGKRILLGVSGSIAAYKSADLASKLAQAGAQVDVILTQAATQFITPLTFQAVTGRRAYVDADLWAGEGHVLHIGLARQAQLLIVVPATANTLAKLAHGEAPDLLSLAALAAECPLLLAPAMDGGMFAHPATQANLETLQKRGAHIIGPAAGHLASGLKGVGRMVEPQAIAGQARYLLSRMGPLRGRQVVVTAGGTQEPLDPVRMLSNRSSGKQGFALAQAALDQGAEVTLIAGPVQLDTPAGAQRVNVQTAEQMLAAVTTALPGATALIMAAAVADFRPAHAVRQKIKKEAGPPVIELARTPDILAAVAAQRESGWPRLVVGFAAESQDLLENAQEKLERKRLDLIVANDILAADAGFAVDTNRVHLLYTDGRREELPLMSKDTVAAEILKRVITMLPDESQMIVHMLPRQDWQAAQAAGDYRPASLEQEGFIHFSRPEQALETANRYYQGQTDLLMLWVNPERLQSPLRWESSHGEVFPHLYGPLPVEAVSDVRPFTPDADGVFRQLPEAPQANSGG